MDEYSIGHFLSGCSRFRGRGYSGNLDDFELKPEDMKKLPQYVVSLYELGQS